MAKKDIGLEEVGSILKEQNFFGGLITKNDYSKVKEWIHSGNYMLNAVLSGSATKGFPNNRTICLAGESGTGKTYVLLNMCREAQRQGYHIIFYDSEGAVDIDTIQNFGVDPNHFDYQPISSLGKFRTSITNLVKKLIDVKVAGGKIPKIMIALDSIGNLATEKEISDAMEGSEKADMTRAKSIRSLFRIVTADLTGLDIPFVFTNHTYACFPGHQLVMTRNGNKKISDLNIGDEVNTLIGYQPIEDIFTYEDSDLVQIELENNQLIECTPNHRFLIGENWEDDSSWIRADELTSGSEIYFKSE